MNAETLLAAIMAQESGSEELLSFQHTPAGSNGQGFGTPVTSAATFTYEGQTYTIVMLFTHSNGVQIRFQTNAQALAFISADFLVDVGITGQPAFRSSVMRNINPGGQQAAQYDAYAGRFVTNTTYTISIST